MLQFSRFYLVCLLCTWYWLKLLTHILATGIWRHLLFSPFRQLHDYYRNARFLCRHFGYICLPGPHAPYFLKGHFDLVLFRRAWQQSAQKGCWPMVNTAWADKCIKIPLIRYSPGSTISLVMEIIWTGHRGSVLTPCVREIKYLSYGTGHTYVRYTVCVKTVDSVIPFKNRLTALYGFEDKVNVVMVAFEVYTSISSESYLINMPCFFVSIFTCLVCKYLFLTANA